MTTVTGSANAACGRATPHQVFPMPRSVMRMNSGMIATVAGNSRPSTNTMNSCSRPLNLYRASG